MRQRDQQCDVSRGDVQCPWRTRHLYGEEVGYLCCGLIENHDGDHEDVYGETHQIWYVHGLVQEDC